MRRLLAWLQRRLVHVEVADGRSSTDFLDVMARFVARRGFPSHLYSNCGINFIGADALFRQWASLPELSSQLAEQGVQWHFNPPAAPHFGRLWEATVKSVKRHLFRAVPSYVFFHSEFTSLLIQIEGCLNSRSLVSLSSGADYTDVLTPAHFLIGQPLIALPVNEVSKAGSLRNHWRELQAALSAFWKVWSAEYLHSLQQRPRWREAMQNIHIGDVVVLKEPTPPSTWRIARVVEVLPGGDGLVRVVRVQVASGQIFERSVHSLVPILESD